MKNTKKYLLLPLFLMVAMAVFAQPKQKFSVVSFEELPLDMTAREDGAKDDGTGSLYAIIKVTSTNPDDDLRAYNFDFNYLKHVVEVKDGELWVYVQRNAKRVNISREGFHPLRNYDLRTTIQAGKVYSMQLTSEVQAVYRQIVQFNITPAEAGAVVFCKGSGSDAKETLFGVTDATGTIVGTLEYGTYTYRVTTTKYFDSEGRFTLNDRRKTHIENVALRANFSTITLNAAEGVEIYIDGVKQGVGSWTGGLKPGVYSVECRKANHKSVLENIKIEEKTDRTFQLKNPEPITGVLAVITRPVGADVYVDGEKRGVSPLVIEELLIGEHDVEVKMANFRSEKAVVEVREKETSEHTFTMSNVANMTLTSNPTGATLYINGENVGLTPYSAEMTSGDYDIRLVKKGYEEYHHRLHLDSSTPEMNCTMKREYQKKSTVYMQGSYQIGGFGGYGGALGAYIRNFNIEGYALLVQAKESIYVNYIGGAAVEDQISAKTVGVKLGYGFIFAPRIRITPQVGVASLAVEGENISSNVITATAGMRCELNLLSRLGVSVTPEYSMAVSKKEAFESMAEASSVIKGWGSGFNIRIGVHLCF